MTVKLVIPGQTMTRRDRIWQCQRWFDGCARELVELMPDTKQRSDVYAAFCVIQHILDALLDEVGS